MGGWGLILFQGEYYVDCFEICRFFCFCGCSDFQVGLGF